MEVHPEGLFWGGRARTDERGRGRRSPATWCESDLKDVEVKAYAGRHILLRPAAKVMGCVSGQKVPTYLQVRLPAFALRFSPLAFRSALRERAYRHRL